MSGALFDERTIEDRMICAYAIAVRSGSHQGTVSIHTGQEGWDWLQEQVAKVNHPDIVERKSYLATAWGFPVLLEAAWATEKIVVRSDQVIW